MDKAIIKNLLSEPNIRRLCDIFGNDADLHIVGGAIRDLILNRQPKDIDFATKLTPQQMIKKLNNASPLQLPQARIMTSQELLPRVADLIEEINQINNLIDYDDPAEQALQTLLDVATDTKTEMETGVAA